MCSPSRSLVFPFCCLCVVFLFRLMYLMKAIYKYTNWMHYWMAENVVCVSVSLLLVWVREQNRTEQNSIVHVLKAACNRMHASEYNNHAFALATIENLRTFSALHICITRSNLTETILAMRFNALFLDYNISLLYPFHSCALLSFTYRTSFLATNIFFVYYYSFFWFIVWTILLLHMLQGWW